MVALLQGTVDVTVQGHEATVNVVEGFIQGRQLLATISVVAPVNADVDVNPSSRPSATPAVPPIARGCCPS